MKYAKIQEKNCVKLLTFEQFRFIETVKKLNLKSMEKTVMKLFFNIVLIMYFKLYSTRNFWPLKYVVSLSGATYVLLTPYKIVAGDIKWWNKVKKLYIIYFYIEWVIQHISDIIKFKFKLYFQDHPVYSVGY